MMTPRVLGIVGGGQLARMLALAAIPLGVRVRVLEPGDDPPAAACAEVVRGAYDDPAALDRLAAGATAVTSEFENVPAAALAHLAARGVRVDPCADAFATAQDRLPEKQCFRAVGLETAPFAAVDDRAGLDAAIARIGAPGILKTRRLGYDGKGQHRLRSPADAAAAWAALSGQPLIYEGLVPFDSECSLLCVRSREGEVRCWPLVENEHVGGILHWSRAPARGAAALQAQAEAHARAILARLGYVGVLAIEFFRVGDRLIGNEMAPRVHNSGHWTIEGARTSQFANHVRAVCGLPLGDTGVRAPSAMRNLVGRMPPLARLLAISGAAVHDYGKAERPGRKLGHVTIIAADDAELDRRMAEVDAACAL